MMSEGEKEDQSEKAECEGENKGSQVPLIMQERVVFSIHSQGDGGASNGMGPMARERPGLLSKSRRKLNKTEDDGLVNGRWTKAEHERFIEGRSFRNSHRLIQKIFKLYLLSLH
jgi:hypothetical protein